VKREDKLEIEHRAKGCCEYCRSSALYSPSPFSVDHIVPRSQNGADTLDNLAFACMGCNGSKYNRTVSADPLTGQLANLFHPRRDRWSDHFCWSEDYQEILALTPIGRATVATLDLNRSTVKNLRRVLIVFEAHPPPESEL
jgi:HNH endonuclease